MHRSKNDAWNYLEERFGVSREDLQDYSLERSSGDFWLVSSEAETGLEVETYGFRFLRDQQPGLKPTTYALQFLGDLIGSSRVELDSEQFLGLLSGEELERDISRGYVALVYDGKVVGCGLAREETLESVIPSGRAGELADIIEASET